MEIKQEKLMTDGYIAGLNPKSGLQANVNLEDGEYIKTPDGSIAQVLGERHTKGGVDLLLPEMTAVLSDTKDLTLEKAQVKELKKTYGIEVSVKNTYSDVLDKYAKKIGLTKLLNEQEDAFTQLKKVTENALSEGSLNVNNRFLQKKIYDLQVGIVEKQTAMGNLFENLFAKQQEAKGEENQIVPAEGTMSAPQEAVDPTIQSAIQGDLTEQQMMKFGGCVGCVDNLKTLAQKYNMTPSEAYALLEKNGKLPKFNEGGWVKFNDYQTKYQNIPTYKSGQLDLQAQRLLDITSKAGYKPTQSNTKTQQEQDALAGEYQKWLYETMPSVAQDYSSSMPPTKKGMEYLVKNGIVTEKDFEAIGVKVPKKAGQVLGLDGDLPEEKIQEVNELIQKKLSSEAQKKEYLKENFIDNKWFFRAPEVQKVEFESASQRDEVLKDYTSVGDNVYKSKKTGLYFIPEVKGEATSQIENQGLKNTTSTDINTTNDTGSTIEDDITKVEEQKRKFPRLFHTPDQSVPPPIGLQAETKITPEFQFIDPMRVGMEDQIKQSGDASGFVASQLESLPPSQRSAVLAGALATTSATESDAITKINQINAQNLTQTELFNIGQADRASIANAESTLNYEQRALRGLSNTQNEIHNDFMANREIYLNKHKEQINMNTINQLFPDVSLDNFGIGSKYDPSGNFQVADKNTNMALAEYYQKKAKEQVEEEKKKKEVESK